VVAASIAQTKKNSPHHSSFRKLQATQAPEDTVKSFKKSNLVNKTKDSNVPRSPKPKEMTKRQA
jgi:hypothetical protein